MPRRSRDSNDRHHSFQILPRLNRKGPRDRLHCTYHERLKIIRHYYAGTYAPSDNIIKLWLNKDNYQDMSGYTSSLGL